MTSIGLDLNSTTTRTTSTEEVHQQHQQRPLNQMIMSSNRSTIGFITILLGTMLIVTIIFGTTTVVIAQQSGSIPNGEANNRTKESASTIPHVIATNSNNYAANIAMLTSGHSTSKNPSATAAAAGKKLPDSLSKYTGKLSYV